MDKSTDESRKISRRGFLSGVASTAATTCIPAVSVAALVGNATPASAEYSRVGTSREAPVAAPIVVENPGYRLMIDPTKGTIVSFRSTYGAGRELLIPHSVNDPLLCVEFMDDNRVFTKVKSSDARHISVKKKGMRQSRSLRLNLRILQDFSLMRVSLHAAPHINP